MNVHEAIYARRSVRRYADRPVERETIEQLLQAAAQAPSAMNVQPWAFGVVQGREALQGYAVRAKEALLEAIEQRPMLARYRDMVTNPDFNLFYHAPALVVIYARPEGPQPEMDCCLAAQNLMLEAVERGLATCWIGFAFFFLSQPEVKRELGVPDGYAPVAPLVIGYPEGDVPPVEKHPPTVLFWQT